MAAVLDGPPVVLYYDNVARQPVGERWLRDAWLATHGGEEPKE